ncbi:LysR family transcriptional regulator [Pseudomonas sp. LP_7_YM]|uniref:LysR family transcriptional regulator n=1 Tax=Pseudomonas sp. LP_7_YM TaxID=2485137 RepID=UPI0021153286|nr:LysR family transcriptional regulator [Pseudomonas sp. LP_7_YM]
MANANAWLQYSQRRRTFSGLALGGMVVDKLDAMRVFVRVVDAGTFTRAADLLNAPKSAVTRKIQALEKLLGVKLLHRTSRRLSLTEAGSHYYQGALKLLDQVNSLESSVAEATQAPRGKVKVGMPGAVAYNLVVPALGSFFELYPDIQLDIQVGNRTADLIAESVDCVIRVGPLMNDSLIARPLGFLGMTTCAAPGYLVKHGIPNHPIELEHGHTLVQLVSPQSARAFSHDLKRRGEIRTLSGSHQISLNDSTAALTAGLAGLGILTTYSFLVKAHLHSGALVEVFPDWEGEQIPVHIALSENRHIASKVRAFMQWTQELFAPHR